MDFPYILGSLKAHDDMVLSAPFLTFTLQVRIHMLIKVEAGQFGPF